MELNKLKISVSSASGVEGITKREIYNLIGKEVAFLSGRADFFGSISDVARLNICLRTANKVYVVLKEFTATTFDELFEGVYSFEWNKLLEKNAKVFVDAKSVKSALFALSSIQSITKKAIVNSLTGKDGFLNETGKEYFLEVSILNDKVSILLNTSGQGLHKRGYRKLTAKAPIAENLAAALIMLTPWNKDRILVDPFCGSGTFPIEAAMMAAGMAPGMNRSFTAEKWPHIIGKKVWYDTLDEANEMVDLSVKTDIQGYDIDDHMVAIARENAKVAGVDKLIHFQRRSVEDLSHPKKYGFIITNPPYGERLQEKQDMPALYKVIGERYKALDSWSMYMITAYEDAEKDIGRKADKNRKIYNGMMKTYYYQFLGPKPPKAGKGQS